MMDYNGDYERLLIRIQRRQKKYITKRMAGIMLAFTMLTSSVLGFGGGILASHISASNTSASQMDSPLSENLSDSLLETSATAQKLTSTSASSSSLSVAQIASLTMNSVVEITTESVTTDSFMEQLITSGAGSGVIVSSDGYIVTNNHVIEDASKITVRLKNGKSYPATLIGTDSKTDIAVIKISATGLTPAVFGNSDSLVVGELAVVIGNPLGSLGGTVTDGIISALDREIELSDTTMNLLQTNAAINPGNSGGGLFNNKGQLVGIVVAKSIGDNIEGLGFAIPINDIKSIISQLEKNGYVQGRIDLGMSLIDISDTRTAMFYRVQRTGVYVKSVTSSSNAASAGFRSGDCILSVASTQVSSLSELNKLLDKYSVGQTVSVTILRNGLTKTISFKLAEYKPA